MEENIDIDDKNETINNKIKKFCSVLMKMPVFPEFVIVSKEKKLKLVESEIIKNLFSDLEGKNKFTDDQDVCDETKSVDILENPPSFDEYQSEFKEMTNREFLKKFIKQMINLNKLFSTMPKWKRICYAFLGFVFTMSVIGKLIRGILTGSKLVCFSGFLTMCAWAGLICSLVFHLSLAVLIPSAIILGIMVIASLIATIRSYVSVYPVRQKYGEDIDQFFDLVGEINQYLDTHDLPPKKISSGEQIFGKSPIEKKIKNADMNEENSVTTDENDDKKSEKSKNK